MPKIDFSFQGRVRGAEVVVVKDVNGESVDVSEMPADELCRRLGENGDLFISLGDYLYENDDAEIEMCDFDATN